MSVRPTNSSVKSLSCGMDATQSREATLGSRPNLSHLTARQEVKSLLETLRLPLDERGRRRAAARAEWFAAVDKPLDIHDIIAD